MIDIDGRFTVINQNKKEFYYLKKLLPVLIIFLFCEFLDHLKGYLDYIFVFKIRNGFRCSIENFVVIFEYFNEKVLGAKVKKDVFDKIRQLSIKLLLIFPVLATNSNENFVNSFHYWNDLFKV